MEQVHFILGSLIALLHSRATDLLILLKILGRHLLLKVRLKNDLFIKHVLVDKVV